VARQKFLLLVGFLAVAVGVSLPTSAWAGEGCSNFELSTTGCVTGDLGNGGVDLHGSIGTPGTGTGTGAGGGDNANGGPDVDPGAPPASADPNAPINRDEFGASGPLTIVDIRHFHPQPGVDRMEPNGWAVIGLDTNFYSIAGAQIVHGTLLGKPADVRFTPVAWHWTYGDGHSATLATGGTTWKAQGIQEFDPTPTSHVYAERGTYAIDLTIDYAPEYRFAGGDWVAVIGVVSLPTNRLTITVGDAQTVLVGRDCHANPTGPGC
jgi:hypothetical protein